MSKFIRIAGLFVAMVTLNVATVLITLESVGFGQAGTTAPECVPGDVNADGVVTVSDPIYLLDYIFLMGPEPVACAEEPILTDQEVTLLRDVLPHLSVVFLEDGNGETRKTVRFSEVNLQLVNGLGATNGNPLEPNAASAALTETNGLGNLIVGYNEASDTPGLRTGSHNVICGAGNDFSGFGGAVLGYENETTAAYSSVVGGTLNSATAAGAVVSGGHENEASGLHGAVSGGRRNLASGAYSSVSGGGGLLVEGGQSTDLGNVASGENSSISGGSEGVASGASSTVTGGRVGTASGAYSGVHGGRRNNSTGEYASVLGGGGDLVELAGLFFDLGNDASGDYATISGGHTNVAGGAAATVSGGVSNTASGDGSTVSGGSTGVVVGVWDWSAGTLFEED